MKKLLFLLLIQVSVQSQNILFVGNSLTYSNDMPDILEYIGKKNGISIKTKDISLPNHAIIDHIKKGGIQKKLAKRKYDYIIIQQGPSSQKEGKKMLIEDGEKIKKICTKYKIELGYFMVWPSISYYHTFDKVIENHKIAAKKNKAILFSVGEKWKMYNSFKNLQSLYSLDNFHPSKAGSFLAALTIFHKLHPKINIENLPYKDYKKWITNKKSFKKIIQIINLN
ncbi:SGNH/GDSL hydrolase family protein [Tenacibaculum ovolyticum]|uniref:SGNH/GDSL hydrolase family protein n=1 Tax=Tenacibaculum ovolyticum TaxID=104270 RepID=UPI001F30DB3A|nr:SGNH/GDSL hydrolase family protein [Tenacibaculum ovolyticum]